MGKKKEKQEGDTEICDKYKSHKYNLYEEENRLRDQEDFSKKKRERGRSRERDESKKKKKKKKKSKCSKEKKPKTPEEQAKADAKVKEKQRKKAAKKETRTPIVQKKYYKENPNFKEKNQLVYDTPRYLLPSELKRLSKSERKRREDELKRYLRLKPEPYRCVRTCIDPKTAKVRYQEYICYPPMPCPPQLSQHPQIAFPKDCKCDPCTGETCTSRVCEMVRDLRAKIPWQEPEECEPITICVPVPDPPPPQVICTQCPLEIRAKDGDFHIVTHKNFKKHIKKMNKKMKKIIKDWEKRNHQRKLRIRRFCQA